VYTATLLIMICAAVASGLSFGRTPRYVIGTLCFFRFWLGFGVGGDYPLSATIMSEYSTTKWRGALIGAVFAMQGIGLLVAAIVTMICTASVNNLPHGGTAADADVVWRVVLMFAAVPTACTIYARSMMPETPRYTLLVEGNQQTVEQDMSYVLKEAVTQTKKTTKTKMPFGVFVKKHWKSLLGCARCVCVCSLSTRY
jgi:PHS family inorganic phosphate transporter-like MFS transporter